MTIDDFRPLSMHIRLGGCLSFVLLAVLRSKALHWVVTLYI